MNNITKKRTAVQFVVSASGKEFLPPVWPEGESVEDEMFRLEAERCFRKLVNLPAGSCGEWEEYRRKLRADLWRVFGVKYNPALPLDIRITGETGSKGFTVKNLSYQSRPGFRVTANLYVPDGAGPFPAVINMHGHWLQGRLAERVQSRGCSLAANGYVCLSVDAFGAGERGTRHGEFEYHGSTLGASLWNIGESLLGIQLVDNMRGVDLLVSLPYVDAKKLGATGASGGGNQTFYLAALDDRVKAAVPVGCLTSYADYISQTNCVCEILPAALTFTEVSGVLALTAPRAVMICSCAKESLPPGEMLRSFTAARPIWQLYGADEKFTCRIFNLTHGYLPEIREAMLGFFDLYLKGIGHGAPRTEKSFCTFEEKELMIFSQGQRDPEVICIAEYCLRRGMELRAKMLKATSFSRRAKREELASILRIALPLNLADAAIAPENGGWTPITITTVEGRQLPMLVQGTDEEKFMLLIHSSGKAAIPHDLLRKFRHNGFGLAVLDLSGQGENHPMSDKIAPYHQFAGNRLFFGQTAVGEWVRELNLAASVLRQRFNSCSVSLYGFGEVGIAALFAAALDGRYAGVTLDGAPSSFVFAGNGIPTHFGLAAAIPGILEWGDISLAAALCKGRVKFVNPRDMAGIPLAALASLKSEYTQLRKLVRE